MFDVLGVCALVGILIRAIAMYRVVCFAVVLSMRMSVVVIVFGKAQLEFMCVVVVVTTMAVTMTRGA